MDEKLLIPRFKDLEEACRRKNAPVFLGFLSEGELSKAREFFIKTDLKVSFFGGYEGALRSFLCLAPDWYEDNVYPICGITFSFRSEDKLSHRDFLGSITAQGISREKIGDILTESGRAVVFTEAKIADHIIREITKVGRVGVTVKKGFEYPLPEMGKCEEFCVTVSSLRLDCIVAAICKASRNAAVDMIEASLVSVNSFLSEKVTKTVAAGDKISVRKKGRFNIISVDGVSKKGKIILKYEKYV